MPPQVLPANRVSSSSDSVFLLPLALKYNVSSSPNLLVKLLKLKESPNHGPVLCSMRSHPMISLLLQNALSPLLYYFLSHLFSFLLKTPQRPQASWGLLSQGSQPPHNW